MGGKGKLQEEMSEGAWICQARSNEIDLVILDVATPKINEVQAFKELLRINFIINQN